MSKLSVLRWLFLLIEALVALTPDHSLVVRLSPIVGHTLYEVATALGMLDAACRRLQRAISAAKASISGEHHKQTIQ
jgi:hypothetical protein